MKSETYKIPLIAILILALIGIGFLIYNITFPKDGRKAAPTDAPASPVEEFIPTKDDGTVFSLHGIITDIDLDSSQLSVMDLDSKETGDYILTGSTTIYTKYDRMITAALLQKGDFVKADYNSEKKLINIKGSDEVWYYKNVMNLIIDDSIKRMTISDNYYHYDDSLLILSDDSFLTLADLNARDVFTVFGVSNNINLIRVTSGHGQLAFAHDEDFIDGTLSINGSFYGTMEAGMQITLPEQDYSILVEKDDLIATATVNIRRGEISVFDLGPYGHEDVATGTVAFSLTPEGTDLYIDGVRVSDPSAVALPYGEHTVLATLGGYMPYRGTLDVNRSDMFINISLSLASEKAEDLLYNDDYNDYLLQYYDAHGSTSDASSSSEDNNDYSDIIIPDSTTDSDIASGGQAVSSGDDSSGTKDDDSIPGTEGSDSGEDSQSGDSSGTEGSDSGTDSQGDDSSVTEGSDSGTDSGVTSQAMIIKCTDGCSVFIDDVFKGTAENGSLRIPKIPGTVHIRLTLEGYVTRSYTVTVDDDGNDAEYTFPALVRE